MLKLKKMLLTIFLIPTAVSCSHNAPKLQGPINRAMPTFAIDENGSTQVMTWRWDEYFTGTKWTTSNEQARQATLICMDLESYKRSETYGKEVKNYVEYLENKIERLENARKTQNSCFEIR